MGGHAFKQTTRIHKDDVQDLLENIANTLNLPNLSAEYMSSNLMGSTGKTETSGDVDIAMNTTSAEFVGQVEWPVFDKHVLLARLQQVLPREHLNTHTFRMGNLMTLWGVGGKTQGLVQVDFIFGDAEWLKFAHYSPGPASRFKGVFVSQTFGVLAKSKVLFRYPADVSQDRLAEVAHVYNLERGLTRRWRLWNYSTSSFQVVDPDVFETKCMVKPPRFGRMGFVNDPVAVVQYLLGDNDVQPEDVNSFEKLTNYLKDRMSDEQWGTFATRLLASLKHSGAKHTYDFETLASDPVFNYDERT